MIKWSNNDIVHLRDVAEVRVGAEDDRTVARYNGRSAVGLGIDLGPLNLDLAYASAARLVPWGGRGGQFALSSILEF